MLSSTSSSISLVPTMRETAVSRDHSGSSLYLPLCLHFCSIYSSEELSVDPVKSAGLSGHMSFLQSSWKHRTKVQSLQEGHLEGTELSPSGCSAGPQGCPWGDVYFLHSEAPTSSTFACRLCQCFHGKAVFSTVYYTAINKMRSHSG